MAYGDFVIQRDLNFTSAHGEIFIIMGPWLQQEHASEASRRPRPPRPEIRSHDDATLEADPRSA
jgi:hypothetical protein